jgi:uncharacterized membrane protein YdbT with pleckstrin-like domain
MDLADLQNLGTQTFKKEGFKGMFEPIFKNSVVLLLQLIGMMLAIDIAFVLFYIFFSIYVAPTALTQALIVTLYIAKYIFQMVVVFRLIVIWANELYYLNGGHIICREGLFTMREKIYECKNIRSISVYQSLLGRLFNYGNLKVQITASGGYNEEFHILNVSDPKRYEFVLGQMA